MNKQKVIPLHQNDIDVADLHRMLYINHHSAKAQERQKRVELRERIAMACVAVVSLGVTLAVLVW